MTRHRGGPLSISGVRIAVRTSWPSIAIARRRDRTTSSAERRDGRLRPRDRRPRASSATPARDTSRRCRCAGSRAARRPPARPCPSPRPTVRRCDDSSRVSPRLILSPRVMRSCGDCAHAFCVDCADLMLAAISPRPHRAGSVRRHRGGACRGSARRVAAVAHHRRHRDGGAADSLARRHGGRAPISRTRRSAAASCWFPACTPRESTSRAWSASRELAALGHPVLTVELPDLDALRYHDRTTDMIEDAAAGDARRRSRRGRAIGVLGISFGGGLSIVAAGGPAIRDGVAFMLAFGGHGDLPRTLRYLCTGPRPATARRVRRTTTGSRSSSSRRRPRGPRPQVSRCARRSVVPRSLAARHGDKAKAAAEFERAKTLRDAR